MVNFAHSTPEIQDWNAHNLEKLRLNELKKVADLYEVPYDGYTTKDKLVTTLMGHKHIADAVQQNPQAVAKAIEQQQPPSMEKETPISVDELNRMKPFAIRAFLARKGIIMPKTAKKAEMLEAWRQHIKEA